MSLSTGRGKTGLAEIVLHCCRQQWLKGIATGSGSEFFDIAQGQIEIQHPAAWIAWIVVVALGAHSF